MSYNGGTKALLESLTFWALGEEEAREVLIGKEIALPTVSRVDGLKTSEIMYLTVPIVDLRMLPVSGRGVKLICVVGVAVLKGYSLPLQFCSTGGIKTPFRRLH